MPETNCQAAGCKHHENIKEVASSRFLKLILEHQNIKTEGRTNEQFFLSRSYVLNHHFPSNTTAIFIATVFCKKAAMTIAMVGQKTFHWQLNKAIPSGTYNCNFEAINSVVNEKIKKVEMKYELFIYTVIYLML